MTKSKKKQLDRDNFVLIKVKALDSSGISVDYASEDPNDSKTYNEKSPNHAHADLKELLNRFKPIMAKIFFWNFGNKVLGENLFGTTKPQAQFLTAYYNEMIDKITITGLSISGMDDNQGVTITCVFDSMMGGVAVNSKVIKFNGTKYGFEEEVEELTEEVRKEAFYFVSVGKVEVDPQQEIEFEKEDDQSDSSESNDSPESNEADQSSDSDQE